MIDYTQATDFAAKDLLATLNVNKVVKGLEIDDEYNALEIAVNSKFDVLDRDVANGLCPLDAGSLVPVGNLPVATEVAIGVLEIATAAETDAGTSDVATVTPLKLQQILDSNAGILEDIKNLASPAAHRLWYWDNTDGAMQFMIAGDGLTIDQTTDTLDVDMLGLEDLVDPAADRLYGFDNTSNLAGFLTVTGGLELDNASGQVRILDKAASTTEAIDITTGDVTLDFSALTAIDVAGTAPTDSLVLNDAGVLKQIDVQDMGIRVVNSSIAQTFGLEDNQTLQVLTGAAPITWDIPTNGTAFPIGAVIYVASRDTATLTISPNTSAVTLTSVLGSDVGPVAGDVDVQPGGTAALIKVQVNGWLATGDLI